MALIAHHDLKEDILWIADRRLLKRGRRKLYLTPNQFKICQTLYKEKGRVISIERFFLCLDYGEETHATMSNVVQVTINHIRRKWKRFLRINCPIQCVRQSGYYWRNGND
jgi:DNA-binding response OmpR family regulator